MLSCTAPAAAPKLLEAFHSCAPRWFPLVSVGPCSCSRVRVGTEDTWYKNNENTVKNYDVKGSSGTPQLSYDVYSWEILSTSDYQRYEYCGKGKRKVGGSIIRGKACAKWLVHEALRKGKLNALFGS